jgi:LysR family transcriptional regulator, low CO2-responsive transcriptional regulator
LFETIQSLFDYDSKVPVDTRVSLYKLEVFELVVSLGGVTAAADHMGVAQPVVSAHIRSLEGRMGTTLFYREGRKLHLTEAGRAVHAWAEDMLRRTRELSRDLDSVSDGLQGSVVIGASMSIGSYRLAPILAGFLPTHPAVDVRVDVLPAAQCIEDTESGENDFSIVVIQPPEPTHTLTTVQIATERLVLVAPPDDSPEPTVITPDLLPKLDYVEAQKGSLRRSFTDRMLGSVGVKERHVIVELGHPEAMKQMVASGVGVCWLFESAVRHELENKSLKELHVEGVDIWGPIFLVHRTDKFFSALHRSLIEQLTDQLAQH